MISLNSVFQKVIISIALLFASQMVTADSLKVLYLGNSHTFYNNLPQLTYNLAFSNGDTIIFESNTPGGYTLGHPDNGHLYNSVSLELINSTDWDYVLLQEQSLFAVIDYYRDNYMYPGARSLDSLIKLNNECTETIVQLIWGKKSGGEYCINSHCTINFVDYSHMQDSLTAKYLRLADSLSCTLAPTGEAWKQIIEDTETIELFNPDESHPSLAGSYLAACVYYAVLFQKSPAGLPFTGGLESSVVLLLQQTADEVVFGNPALWNIDGNIPVAGFEIAQTENTIVCNDTSVNADFYLWDFGDGTTDTLQHPSHIYTASGTYVISQEVSTSCFSDITMDTVVVDVINSSVAKKADQGIYIYGGLINGEFVINSASSKMYKVDLYGLEGNLVHTENLNGDYNHSIKINSFPVGIYILVVYTNNGAKTFKVSNPG